MSNQIEKCAGCRLRGLEFVNIVSDEEQLIEFLINHGLICSEKLCDTCGEPCKLVRLRGCYFYRCRKSRVIQKHKKRKQTKCDFIQSVRNNTYFSGSHLSLRDICLFVFYEMSGVGSISVFLKNEFGCSSETIINWTQYLREVLIDWAADNHCGKLGGPGKMIDVYEESVVSKRNNSRGVFIDGQWVYAVFERDTKKLYIQYYENRSKETLYQIIRDKINDGSTVISDCWSSYQCLEDEDFIQLEENRSLNFVDHVKNPHNFLKYARKNVGYLALSAFKAQYPSHLDRFHHIFTAISNLYNPQSAGQYIEEYLNNSNNEEDMITDSEDSEELIMDDEELIKSNDELIENNDKLFENNEKFVENNEELIGLEIMRVSDI